MPSPCMHCISCSKYAKALLSGTDYRSNLILQISKVVDDIVYEIEGQLIVVKEGEINTGGNPSAEEQEEALADGAQQVNNVVHSHRLQATSFDKKSYLTYLKVRI